MKRKGFTLIELLAVIVIIAIIALIAVPVIGGIIEESRLGAFKASSLSVIKAYENYQAEHGFEDPGRLKVSDLALNNNSYFISGEVDKDLEEEVYVQELTNGVYCASGGRTDLRIVKGSCELLDTTPPIILSVNSSATTNSITVYVTYSEEESSIFKHEYRIVKEGGNIEDSTWVSGDTLTENLSTKLFTNLEQGQTYKIQVKLTNIAVLNSESEIYDLTVSTIGIEKPVITSLTNKEFAVSKEIQITYPDGNGFSYQYSLDGTNWIDTKDKITTFDLEENRTIQARVYDGYNYVYATPLTISGIDRTTPVVSVIKGNDGGKNVLTATTDPETTPSGYYYTWYKDGQLLSNETKKSLTTISSGTYKVVVTTGAGIKVESEFTIRDYTITYNLNGGQGTIASQIKVEDIPLTLTNIVPTRSGYQFQGWGITSSDKVVSYSSGSSYTKNEGVTLYAIWKKGYTVTFIENGATLSKKTETCDIYNGETSCTLITPTITRSGYVISGFGESADSKTSVVGNNATLTVSGNKTYYAVTSKVLTANFNKNTVSSISAASSSCTIYNTETSCNLTLPTITPQTNFTNNGWGTSAGQTSNGVTSIALNISNAGSTWYALNSRTLTWNFNKNTVSSISTTSRSCTIWNTGASCVITTPTITPQTNFTQGGFGTAAGSTSATIAQNASMTLNNTTTGGTYYALNSRVLTWNFNKNTVSSISATSRSCTIWSTSGTCQVTTPTITAQTNFTQQGFGTAAGSTSATVAQNVSMTLNNTTTGGTYYALNSRTLTWNFNKNTVSSISATSRSCTIWNTGASCTITTPTITPQTNFTQGGFGTAAGSTSATVAQNASMTLNNTTTGGTYYALNSRTLTWNFNKNAVSSVSATSRSCTIWNTSGSCTITTPTITASSGYTVIGFSTSSGATTSSLAPNTTVTFSNSTTNQTYYALQKKTVTVSYNGNGSLSGSVASQSCTMYNANTSCAITVAANGYSNPGYNFSGWATGTTVSHKAGTSYNFSNNTTLKAIWAIITPTITGGSTSWATSRTISITNAPSNLSNIARYEYYYTTSSTAPTSTTAATGNIGKSTSKVFNTNFNGYYIYFRAVGTNGSVSAWSSAQRLYVDVNSPTISSKGSSFTVNPKSNNNLSSYFNLGQNGGSAITSTVCTSNIDGKVTNTSTLSTNTSSNKSHVITCTVTKANGKTASASTTIVVQSYCSSKISSTTWGSCNASCGYGTQSGTIYYKSSYDNSISCGTSSTSQSCYAGKPCSYAASANYSCPSGYTSSGSGSSMRCSKTTTTSASSTSATPHYSCSSGTLSGSSCVSTSTISSTRNEAKKTYSCSSGTLSGTSCISTSTISSTRNEARKTYSCSSGTLSGTSCVTKSTTSPSVSYSCSSGTKSGSKCYSCPSGGTLSGTTCTKMTSTTVSSCSKCPSPGVCRFNAEGHYVCEMTSTYSASSSNATASYSCPSGYTKGGSGSSTTCTKTTTTTATSTCPSGYTKSTGDLCLMYSCPSGYTKNGSGSSSTCTKTTTTTATSTCPSGYTKSTGDLCLMYSCPSGYTKNGSGSSSTCTKTTTTSASISRYSCSSGTLNGSKCYSCSSGSLSGTSCVSTSTASPNVSYSCPNGGSLSGTTCYY